MRCFILISCLMLSTTPSFAKDRSEILKAERTKEFIYDWSAMGSGCKGRLMEPEGNVALEAKPPVPPFINRHQLRFVLNKFKLQSPVPADQGKTNLEFARDCAIRVALNPPPGKKIADIDVNSTYALQKPDLTEIRTMAQLSLGMARLSETRANFDKREVLTKINKELRLTSDDSRNGLSEVKCGQSKLMGIDLIFYVDRPNEGVKVDMSLDKNTLDVVVDLEDCV